MSRHTRERKRIWCRLFGHGFAVFVTGDDGKPWLVCSRCGTRW